MNTDSAATYSGFSGGGVTWRWAKIGAVSREDVAIFFRRRGRPFARESGVSSSRLNN
jgi:hypothetical protein